MTNAEKLTTAELVKLNQHLAEYGEAVDAFIEQTALQVMVDGPVVATAVLADHVAIQLDEDQLATVAAIMLVRLAQQRPNGGDQR